MNPITQAYKGFKKLIFLKRFYSDFRLFQKFAFEKNRVFELRKDHPCLEDKTQYTGFDRHYIYHNAWAIRKVLQIRPEMHVDISSTLYFSTALSAMLPVNFYDYRPAKVILDNYNSLRGDLMALPFENDSVKSLSCMHTIEHIGLGRYGDKIDFDGDLKACNEISRVLAKDGDLLIVVPVGYKNVVHYNAHRVYAVETILNMFSSNFFLNEFTLIPENEKDGGLIINPSKDVINRQNYGCGCFWFKRK